MNKHNLTLFIVLFNVIVLCAQTKKNKSIIYNKSSFSQINSIDSEDFSDLTFIDSLINDKKIVFLGESQHGINDFNILKYRLIRYLHQKHGFNVVIFESGIGACGLTNLVKDSLTGMEMLVHSLMGIWRVKGNCKMMDYLRDNNMELMGVDPNNAALGMNVTQYNYVLKDERLSKNLVKMDSLMFYEYQIPKNNFFHNKENFTEQVLDSVSSYLINEYLIHLNQIKRNNHINNNQKKILIKMIESKVQVLSTSNNKSDSNFFITNNERDSLMAFNLEYLKDSLYPNQKIIVWAHNAHISKISANKYLNGGGAIGSFLSEETKKESYVIGLYSVSGSYSWGNSPPQDIKLRKRSLEYSYQSFTTKALFVKCNMIKSKKYYHGIPDYFKSNISKLYDGVIFIRNVESSILIPYNKEFKCE